jgi:hypothetical protein
MAKGSAPAAGNPKFEIHPPEAGKISKFKCSNNQNNTALIDWDNPLNHWNLGHWVLFRASSFGFEMPFVRLG